MTEKIKPSEFKTVIAADTSIETERLFIRPFREDDFEELCLLRSQETVVEFLYEEIQTRENTRQTLDKRLTLSEFNKEGDNFVWAVIEKESNAFVGDLFFFLTSVKHLQGEIGFVFNPEHHGKGYGYEAAMEMLRFGFDILGLHRIVGRCDGRNKASAALMKKLGLELEAHFIGNEWVKGCWTDEMVFAMRRSQWDTQAQPIT